MRTGRKATRLLAGATVGVLAAGCGSGSGREDAEGATDGPRPLAETAATLQTYVADVWPRTGEIWPGADFSTLVLLVTDGSQTWVATATDEARTVSNAELAANGAESRHSPAGSRSRPGRAATP